LGFGFLSFVHPEDRDLVADSIKQALIHQSS